MTNAHEKNLKPLSHIAEMHLGLYGHNPDIIGIDCLKESLQ